MGGPYATESEALAEPMPQAVAALHVSCGFMSEVRRQATTMRHAFLVDACEAAHVDPGPLGRRSLEWAARTLTRRRCRCSATSS
jgi:hypothetical protein